MALSRVAVVVLGLGILTTSAFSTSDGRILRLHDTEYFVLTADPIVVLPYLSEPFEAPATHISLASGVVTEGELQQVVDQFLATDDVFSLTFTENIIISRDITTWNQSTEHGNWGHRFLAFAENVFSAVGLDGLVTESFRRLESNVIYPYDQKSLELSSTLIGLPQGPLYAAANGTHLHLSKVFRLYEDRYRTFVNGIYDMRGSYKTLDYYEPYGGYAKVPIPSRLYSIGDERPLAGKRIGVKDIFDIKGVKSTWGSRAHSAVVGEANETTPSIQRILDLGGVIVGKQKTAQFASAQPAWDWIDYYCPENPRGDGLLSCSASSTGAGCSIAAYDWLDFAIGSDTGQSVRQPAAFSGTYGNRPSQGMMSLEGVMPIGYAVDTAGVFSRNPDEWVAFAKAWYDESLYQDPSITGLPALSTPDERTFPKRILYPIDSLPLKNGAAEALLQHFLANVSAALNLTVERFNITSRVEQVTGRTFVSIVDDLNVLFTYDQARDVALPLLEQYKPHFPVLEKPHSTLFWNITLQTEEHERVLRQRNKDAELWHSQVLFATNGSCSESIIVYDIGTGGLPSFRLKELNESPGASFATNPNGYEAMSAVASYFGDVDITIPIGQVSYFSNVTREENVMPVTVSLIARRRCDLVLFNMVSELARQVVLRTVATGRQAFV